MNQPLKERLVARYEARGWDEHGPAIDSSPINPDGPEALARIEVLEGALRKIRLQSDDCLGVRMETITAICDHALNEGG